MSAPQSHNVPTMLRESPRPECRPACQVVDRTFAGVLGVFLKQVSIPPTSSLVLKSRNPVPETQTRKPGGAVL